MTPNTDDVAGLCPGPCIYCGSTGYEPSCGGPMICPKCDCGNFDAATVLKQAKVISGLRSDLESQAKALREAEAEITRLQPYVAAFRREEARADAFARQVDDLEARLKEAEKVIGYICWFDWSNVDPDAVAAIDAARAFLNAGEK